MKNHIALFIILLILTQFSITAPSDVEKGTLYVDDDNLNGPWDGSLVYPYQHIQDALNVSSDGDTVFVFNGTYTELIRIDKEVALMGEDNSATILQDIIQDAYTDTKLLIISADNVTVENFCIRQHNNTNFQHSLLGIYCTESDGFRIQQNHIVNCIWAINLWSSSGNILNNHIYYESSVGRTAIKFESPTQESELIISNNTIINYNHGIFIRCHLSAPSQMLIDYNYMISSIDGQEESEGYGIRLYYAVDQNYYMRISHNEITGFLVGFYYKDVWCGGPILDNTSVDIFSNLFDNINNDLRLSPNPIRSDEKITITKNNFFGRENNVLFLNLIILDPTSCIDYTGMIHKSSIEWTNNYWANHSVDRTIWISGRLVFYLSHLLPFDILSIPIYQTEREPATNPHEI